MFGNIHLSKSGVALLMALGILALLAILAVSFATHMRLSERTTRDFNYEKQAREIAEAGIERAIAELKNDARNNFIFQGIGPFVEEDAFKNMSGNVDGKYEVTITDTASQVNINSNITNLANMLANLPNMTIGEANAIVTLKNTLPNNKFTTKQQIRTAEFGSGQTAINEEEYNAIKDYITIHSYEDNNCNNRSAININTADLIILVAALEPLDGVTETEAQAVANHLATQTYSCTDCGGTGFIASSIICPICGGDGVIGRPYRTWAEFDRMVDQARTLGYILISP